ncbi:aminopeptidase M1-C-like isoform X3 [Aegilops tauschii subsp. strangulata]|nr:aminopeptidase M1-B-like isoform X3 [Aegilops tauschii subsp. strangulata]
MVALSNMPISSEIVRGSMRIIHFEESPLMSTYLVAMVVGIFDFVEDVTSKGTKVRVYTEVGKSSQGKLALDVGVKSLDFYNDYFGTPYALAKLDMISIPEFNWMGMENYGLITFHPTVFLFDGPSTTSTKLQEIAVLVAHELAHQWCGNLVTMEWWNHLWLNEGFATWMSYQAVDSFFQKWNILLDFLENTMSTLKLDSIAGSHPIEVEIHHINEIVRIFDDIIYIKGASILQMIHSYIGAERFQIALKKYIQKYAYSNAKTEDLWVVLEEETGEPFKDFMSTWTKQPGFPIINIKHKGKGIQVEQAQFVLDGSSRAGLWDVPITLRCSSSTNKFILKHKHDNFDVCGERERGGNIWIKLNVNETGFYRVKYDKEIKTRLQNALEANEFSSMEKIGILENSLMLSISREDTLASLLCIAYTCREVADYNVLTHIQAITITVYHVSIDATPNLVADIKKLVTKILLPPTLKLGWDPKDGEGDLIVSLRETLLVSLVKLGHDHTISEGLRRFDTLIHDHNSSILSPGTRKENWDRVLKVIPKRDLLWSIVHDILPLFTTNEKAEEIAKVFRNYTDPELQSALQVKLQMVRINMRWIDGIQCEPNLAQMVDELLHEP